MNFLSLARGGFVAISGKSLAFYLKVCELLESDAILTILLSRQYCELSIATVLDQFRLLRAVKSDDPQAIAFAAPHLNEIKVSDFSLIESNISLLSTILCHPSFHITDENSLVSLKFENLSSEGIRQFIELIWESFDSFSFSISQRLCSRLIFFCQTRFPESRTRNFTRRESISRHHSLSHESNRAKCLRFWDNFCDSRPEILGNLE